MFRLSTCLPANHLIIRRSFCSNQIRNLLDTRVENKEEEWARSVYPSQQIPLSLIEREEKVKTDPKTTSIILFPGHGSQYVGMGSNLLDFPNVPEMFEIACRVLGYNILNLCINGPKSQLNRTDYSQAATFLVSLAAVEKLRFRRPSAVERCVATAGFSVGEFAALVMAGSIEFEDALRLVKLRGELMKAAAESTQSGLMNVIFGADARINLACSSAVEWCKRKGIPDDEAVCSIAYYLFPHCKVIGGHEEALNFLENNKKDFGIKRCTRLPDAGAFHTPLMRRAAEKFAMALDKTRITDSKIPVFSNTDARPMRRQEIIRKSLAFQMSSPCKLEQIYHEIYSRSRDANLPFTFSCGPGNAILKVLEKTNMRAYKQAQYIFS